MKKERGSSNIALVKRNIITIQVNYTKNKSKHIHYFTNKYYITKSRVREICMHGFERSV